MKLALYVALAALSAPAAMAADDDHPVHSCACEAEEFGFKIDCADKTAMLDALEFLKTNGCATTCEDETECHTNFLIIQSHHDYCPEADIPEEVEDGLHDFEAKCTACEIRRAFTEGAPDCPKANCDDESGSDAYTAAVEAGCMDDCSSEVCKKEFTTLRVVHDSCPHDTLTMQQEVGLHDLEGPCKDVVCNAVDGDDQQLVCKGDDHDDHDHADHGDHGDHDDHDDHDDHPVHSCACEAEEFKFKIDCADKTAMLDALQYLKTNDCATTCEDESQCHVNYLIIQSHHDYCPEADIPEEIEDGLHDFEAKCTACEIRRAFTEGAPDCPKANCDDGSGNAAYEAAVDAGCMVDCSSEKCKSDFTTLRVVHDSCPHDTLSIAAEKGLHDLEVPCKDVLCNAVDGDDQQLVCKGDDHDDHDHAEHSSHDETESEGTASGADETEDEGTGSGADETEEEGTGSGAAVASAAAALASAAILLVV